MESPGVDQPSSRTDSSCGCLQMFPYILISLFLSVDLNKKQLKLRASVCMQRPTAQSVDRTFVYPADTFQHQAFQYMDNVIFADIFSCLLQTGLTFKINISSYREYVFDRFVCCHGEHKQEAWIYLRWHFDVPLPPRCELPIKGSSLSSRGRLLTHTTHLRQPKLRVKSLLSHLW